jgi:hypothetical protein
VLGRGAAVLSSTVRPNAPHSVGSETLQEKETLVRLMFPSAAAAVALAAAAPAFAQSAAGTAPAAPPATSAPTASTGTASPTTTTAPATGALTVGLPVKDKTGAVIGQITDLKPGPGGQQATVKMGEQSFSIGAQSFVVLNGAAVINATEAQLKAMIAGASKPG